jgi:hypothetical protein
MATKNPFGRDNPTGHFTLKAGDWTFVVRKLYKSPANSIKDPYSRAFCHVITPMTGPRGDLGDTYCKEVPGLIDTLKIYLASNPTVDQ